MVVELGFLCIALGTYCGPLYLANMVATTFAYFKYTRSMGVARILQVRSKKEFEKKQEFFQNESITNYETVKAFNNETLEQTRYKKIVSKLKNASVIVQQSLTQLNVGQDIIFNTGTTINLLLAAYGVSSGRITPGDFVMIQALFLQLAGPLHNVGVLFREIDQSTIDIEDLYKLLNSTPNVIEKPDSTDFEFKEGKIKFENLKF